MMGSFNDIYVPERGGFIQYAGSAAGAVSEYGEAVWKFVEGNLEAALIAKVNEHPNTVGEAINRKALYDNEFRYNLIKYIVEDGISNCLGSYKLNLDSEKRRQVFMEAIHNTITYHQICRKAEYYFKNLNENYNRSQSR